MVLNDTAFKKLLENLPSVEVCLEWDGEEGRAEVEGHEMTSGNYIVFADFNVYESGTYDAGDYFTEPSFTSHGVSVDDFSFDIFNNITDEQIHLTDEQFKQLTKEIESSISTTV